MIDQSVKAGLSLPALPYRGRFGDARPPALAALALPPDPMPSRHGLRPLKAWRYVGVFAEELMLCLATVRIGPAGQSFWAVWDRGAQRLREHTAFGRGPVVLRRGRAQLDAGPVQLDLRLHERPGIETVCAAGTAYTWTRKQGGIAAEGTVILDGVRRELGARAVVDDSAGYHERHTRWRWAAGVGTSRAGAAVAWNLVAGINDPLRASERTVWLDGDAVEAPPCRFAPDLRGVDELSFRAEAVREREENLLLVRSSYRQPFGTFSGRLPGGVELAAGLGVMEEHEAWW